MRTRLAQRLAGFLLIVLANGAILAALDWTLVKLDLLEPPFSYGHAELGFGSPGVRRSTDYGVAPVNDGATRLTVAMVGDSHSELWLKNPLDGHEFVLESALRREGLPIDVVSAGRGRYSPVQEYLLFKGELKEAYHPRILLMNFYSGNDFYDMLRPDDRPHFERDEHTAIVMKEPVWISFVNPAARSWSERSRLLWAIDETASRLGFPRVTTRLRMLTATVNRSHRPVGDSLKYLADLRRSQDARLRYPAAFAAQVLNQALFFRHFPETKPESIAYLRHLLRRAREENPGVLLVLSSIPSAAVMGAVPHDIRQPWLETLGRTSLTEPWVADLESTLVDELGRISTAEGWLFIDLRNCLREPSGGVELYSSFDLHINAAASRRIGHCQADALLGSEDFNRLVNLEGAGAPKARHATF